jgi:TonB family protein
MSNEKILVVEFEENSLNSLSQTLKTEGFEVVTAKDGHEGLLKFESENPDLVIMEPMLLKLHGFDLCRKISKDARRKTPVIITTGFYKGDHYKSEAIETFGASAFFEKPYDSKDLMSTVHSLLSNGTGGNVQEVPEVSGNPPKKKNSEIDIEATVKEMEKSLKEPATKGDEKGQRISGQKFKKGESEISSAVDELLQGTLSEFGLRIDKKAPEKKVKDKPRAEKPEKTIEEIPPADKMESVGVEQAVEPEKESREEGYEQNEEEKELQTEELIEELIRKEEEIEEEDEPDKEKVALAREEEPEVEEETAKEEVQDNQQETGQKIFEDYFEQPEKSSFLRPILGFFKKLKKPIPLMIASTVVVVLVATGATLLFLKLGSKSSTISTQKNSAPLSSVERTVSNSSEVGNPAPLVGAQGKDMQKASLSGGNIPVEAGDPSQKTASDAGEAEGEKVPESTSEFMSVTSLSSNERQVMLPNVSQSPSSREFETVEVQEANVEQLAGSDIDVDATPLGEAAKRIIQPEDPSERIKTGDLVPIESVDILPVATKKTNPKYPPYAFQRGIEATVVFRALISEFGNVLDIAFIDTSRSAAPFNKACEEAVRNWKFLPAKKNGINVKVWKTFSISFKKNKSE